MKEKKNTTENFKFCHIESKNKDLDIIFSDHDPEKLLQDKSIAGLSKMEKRKALYKPFYVAKDLFVYIRYFDNAYRFTIPAGYDWNGANVPPFAWLLIGQSKEPRFKLPSCIHDYLCEHKQVINYDRYLSTLVFITLCEHFGGFNKFKLFTMFHCVDNYQKLKKWSK